ncbi:MAG: UDP-N-acetylmuramoyl-L-alanine--D-glutamate ligase [Cyanothece sp. SIO1E1]|nr:UDP-N-acetylmuramoyl-L-alanine--D-glutamate ligase [Cyanothece sp. SIO1E1]
MPNAYVIGLGSSGVAAAKLLKRDGWQVTVSDRGTSPALMDKQQALMAAGITVKLGHTFDPSPVWVEKIVVSPGVPWDLPALVKARELGIETMGEMELAWQHLRSQPWIGITGTNGKTTTTALIAAIFQAAGLNAPACGNIGYAACDLALAESLPDWIIAELSSYQIEASPSIAPQISVWTTLTPDHLSRHKTLENYTNIKARLLNQSKQQILNGDDPYLRQQRADDWPQASWTSINGKDAIAPLQPTAYIKDDWVIAEGDPILPVQSLKMVGNHNRQNLLMAVAVARLAGIEKAAIAHAITTFPGVPHRLEHVCTWQEIDFINDSKATNYDAAEVGLRSVNSPAILIAGGEAKAGDDTGWIGMIQAQVAAVLLIGAAAPTFAQRLAQVNYAAYEIVETMDQAVEKAAKLAQQYGAKVVLLSPACASFDQYPNFEKRGDHFRQLCQDLLG